VQQSDFVHLHCHSDYSLLDGLAQIPQLVKRTKECGQRAIALTDHGTVSGAINFYKECQKQEIKPILGCEVYVANGKMTERKRGYKHLTVLAKNDVGWRNLSKLTSLANLEGFYYKPRIDLETLKAHREGLVVVSGCLKGPVPVLLQQDDYAGARALAGEFKEAFGEDYYLEVQPNSLEQQKVVNEGCLRLAKEVGIKLAATCDLHYIEPEDAPAQEIRICIGSGKTLQDENRLKMKEDFFFRTSEQMFSYFKDTPEAIFSTREIAEKVTDYDLLPGLRNKYFLPKFLAPDGSDSEEYFDKCCHEGLRKRYGPEPSKEALERLEYEKEIIRTLGFTTYFLIVADFIRWARENSCSVGPGRGSAAGSIVAYVLWITDIDPLRYDLLFERFLNPSRVSMPDIDVDFCEANRGRVIDYVREKYGQETVCQIVTFGTLKPKAVIKDVGRVLSLPFSDVDRISKLIPDGPKLKTLEQAFRESPELNALRQEPHYEKLFDMALRLEGINRHCGKHAAGVVIADTDLVDRIPLTLVKGDKTTAFTMTEVEECGLLKMDFLGLRTLTLIDEVVRLIAKRGIEVDPNALPLDDTKTFELLSRGETMGVFQLESSGFRKLLKEARPDRFEDIIALIALYRPGPLGSGMDQQFIDRKHGREEITYLTDHLAPILGETYGCILYQEQVMRIANMIAGLSMADADNLRKAMGKKKLKLMEKYKPQFVEGFVAKGIDGKIAEEVWSQIAFFAEYGFNKSHSAAYGLVTYQTAYLKAHYPVEFMAATLTSWSGDTDRVLEYKNECVRREIELLPPNVNTSDVNFDVRDQKIYYGLGAIKGMGEAAAEEIVRAREEAGPEGFRSIFHLCGEVDAKLMNKAALEALIAAGAFDSTGAKRRQLSEVAEQAIRMGIQEQKDKLSRQTSLFGTAQQTQEDLTKIEEELLPNVEEWSDTELLANEKSAIGFYLTQHPLDSHQETITRFATQSVLDLKELPEGAEVTVGGLVIGLRTILDRRNNTMAFVTLEDYTGTVDCVIFGSVFADVRQHVTNEAVVFISGKVSKRNEAPSIVVDRVFPVDEAEGKLRVAVSAELVLEETTEETFRQFRETLLAHRGNDPVYYSLRRQRDQAVAGPFRVGSSLKVSGTEALRLALCEVLGPSARVRIGARL